MFVVAPPGKRNVDKFSRVSETGRHVFDEGRMKAERLPPR